MSEMDDLVAELVRDSDRLRLPPPSALRATGDARTRRHVLAVVGVAVLVVAVLGGAGLALADSRPQPVSSPPRGGAPIVPGSSGVAGPTASPSAAEPTSPAAPSTPIAAPSPAACTAVDLTFVDSSQDAGMGSAFTTYVFSNRGPHPCWVSGAPRMLAAGQTVPSTYASGGDAIVVAPARQASFQIREVNGYGGYGPGSPQCAHPATYRDLSVVLADGSAVSLGNSTISVQCGEIDTALWTLAG